jgi:hypothetical protein
MVLPATLVLLTMAGCGGDSGSASADLPGHVYSVEANTTVTTGSLSKAEFFARATATCIHRQTIVLNRFKSYRDEHRRDMSPSELIAKASQMYLLPGIQFQFDELRLMGAPEGDKDQVEEMLGAFQFAIEKGQRSHIGSAEEFGKLFRVHNELAVAYGLGHCAVDRKHFEPVWAVEAGG